jgi:predicted transport protein
VKEKVLALAEEFTKETHGSTDYDKDTVYVMGNSANEYVPFNFLKKKINDLQVIEQLQSLGFIFSSSDFLDETVFKDWYSRQFSKKLSIKDARRIGILHYPDTKQIFDSVEKIDKCYELLRESFVIINGKNFPVQLGEWYSKCIFGLKQLKSTSQRGFDFVIKDNKKVEVKVHWNDSSSPKGVKLKKSLLELSDYTIIIYISRNLMIRDVIVLDSEYVIRKFGSKGHTIFLKDSEVTSYFFSRSTKHFDKVVNKTALMKFASPQLAMKLDGRL